MKQFWDKMAKSYTKNTERIFGAANQKIINKTKDYCTKDMNVLDVGCGTGLIIRDIAPFVNKVMAIDTSAEMIKEARKNKISNVTWDVCNFLQMETEESYHMITAFNILRYIKNTDEFLQKIYDILPAGGYFVSATDCVRKDNSIFLLIQRIGQKIGLFPYMKNWKINELKECILSIGFEEVYDENVFEKYPNYLVIVKKQRESTPF